MKRCALIYLSIYMAYMQLNVVFYYCIDIYLVYYEIKYVFNQDPARFDFKNNEIISETGVNIIEKQTSPMWKLGSSSPSDSEKTGILIKIESKYNINPDWIIEKMILKTIWFFL